MTSEEAIEGKVLILFQEIKFHLIFNIKIYGKFTHKSRFFAGRHTTKPPAPLTNYSIDSKYFVRIAFTLYSLNYIDIWACYIGNTYLNIKYREKICMKSGTKFGDDKVKVVIVIRALYVLK